MMSPLLLLFGVAAFASAHPRNDCVVVNREFDRLLAAANQDFLDHGNPTIRVNGIEQVLYLDWSGYSIPVPFHLETTPGTIVETASSRSGDAVFCSGRSHRVLEAAVQFDTTILTYDKVSVSYLKVLSIGGSLTYSVRPTVNVIITQTPTNCSVSFFSMASTDDVTYKVTPNYWFENLVALRVQSALQDGGDSSAMLSYLQNTLRQFTESYIKKQWCQPTNEHSEPNPSVSLAN